MVDPPAVTFGSAHLFQSSMTADTARALLEAALAAGATRLDTAPMYGHGASEALVAEVALAAGVPVTTKVGIEPTPPPSPARLVVARAVRALPAPLEQAVRRVRSGASPLDPDAASGRFGLAAVRASVERSLRLLRGAGRIDRLLLHEVWPGDVTDELLAALAAYRDAGDVRELGVATQNAMTVACLERGAGLLTAAHVSAAPGGSSVPPLPAGVHGVGHGLLGAGGADLAALQRRSPLPGPVSDPSLARALVRYAATRSGLGEVVVATSRPDRVADLVTAPGDPGALDDDLAASITRILGAS